MKMTLSVLYDSEGCSAELSDALTKLESSGRVFVHITGTSRILDAGVPFPVAVLRGTEEVKEFGPTAVLALVRSLLNEQPGAN